MIFSLVPVLTALVSIALIHVLTSLRRNIQSAKRVGTPYVVIPFHPLPLPRILLLPLTRLFVRTFRVTAPWAKLCDMDWQFHAGYDMFREVGSDVFLTVSPFRLVLHVCDPQVATEVLGKRGVGAGGGEEFVRAGVSRKLMSLFGMNVFTTVGETWRAHRRATVPVVVKSLPLVWDEAVSQTEGMLGSWASSERPIVSTHTDVLQATLGVISYVGFSNKMGWTPARTQTQEAHAETEGKHHRSHQSTLGSLMQHFIWAVVAPSWFLRVLPWKNARDAGRACDDFRICCNQWFEEKKSQIDDENRLGNKNDAREDIMTVLIKGAGLEEGSTVEDPTLTKEEVIGNSFIFLAAGYETTGSAFSNCLYFLAMYPEYQTKLQRQIDEVFADRKDTSYKQDFGAFSEGWMTAIFFEILRLYPPIMVLLRESGESWRTLDFQGKTLAIPPRTDLSVEPLGMALNAKHWVRPGQSEEEAAVTEFRPERWLTGSSKHGTDSPKGSPPPPEEEAEAEEESGLAADKVTNSANLFRPRNGTFIPFSWGNRSCIGQKFAHVQFAAVMSSLFRTHNVRLAMEPGDVCWEDARRRCLREMRKFETIVTFQPTVKLPGLVWVAREEFSAAR